MAGEIKEAGSLLVATVKAGLIGGVTRKVGQSMGGNVGELIGGLIGAVIQAKTGDEHKLAPVLALVTTMDVMHNWGLGGGAAEGQEKNVRREM